MLTRIGLARAALSRYHPGTLPVSPPPGSEPSRSSSRLIADGDSVARNAFRVGLREETPLPIAGLARSRSGGAGVTQELDPGDILEVQDMAEAIARAEQLVRTPPPRSSAPASAPDMFDDLGRRSTPGTRATDDTAGPASPAPPYAAARPTPAPPSSSTRTATAITPAPVPRYVTMPSAAEDDAFFHPIGRIRSLADVTLDGYRAEPTLLVRAASRRKRFAWIFVAALLPLLVLAAIAVFANTGAASPIAAVARVRVREPSVTARGRTPLATTSARAKSGIGASPASGSVAPASLAPTTPVVDVKSLPSTGAPRVRR